MLCNTLCKKSKRRKNAPHYVRRILFYTIGLVILFSLLLSATSASERKTGPHYPMPYPLGVGDHFTTTTHNTTTLDCTTLYAWEDGSSVATCNNDQITLAHNPNTNTWDVWKGCYLKLTRHGTLVNHSHNLLKCYGTPYLA